METASTASVSDKKQWLANAFKKPDGEAGQARTELVTEQEKRDDASARAKQIWRERATCERTRTRDASSKAKEKWRERSAGENRLPPTSPSLQRKGAELYSPSRQGRNHAPSPPVISMRPDSHIGCSKLRQKENNAEEGGAKDDGQEESEKEVGFSEARKLLVQRSKKNGHDAFVLTKVGLKKAKFERIERENRRRNSSQGQLKPQWSDATPAHGRHSTTYVRSFGSNPAPKKSMDELP